MRQAKIETEIREQEWHKRQNWIELGIEENGGCGEKGADENKRGLGKIRRKRR